MSLAPSVSRRLNEPNTREAQEGDAMNAMESELSIDDEFPALSDNWLG